MPNSSGGTDAYDVSEADLDLEWSGGIARTPGSSSFMTPWGSVSDPFWVDVDPNSTLYLKSSGDQGTAALQILANQPFNGTIHLSCAVMATRDATNLLPQCSFAFDTLVVSPSTPVDTYGPLTVTIPNASAHAANTTGHFPWFTLALPTADLCLFLPGLAGLRRPCSAGGALVPGPARLRWRRKPSNAVSSSSASARHQDYLGITL